MTDKAETAIAYLATRFNRCAKPPNYLAHSPGSLGDEECAKTIRPSWRLLPSQAAILLSTLLVTVTAQRGFETPTTVYPPCPYA